MELKDLNIEDDEIEEKPWSKKDEIGNEYDFRQDKVDRGKLYLLLKGIDLEKQRKYFEIMKENDMPIGNGLLAIEFALTSFRKESNCKELIGGALVEWEAINNRYQKIDIENQDENTGKEIIIKMKGLILELLKQLKVWQENPIKLPEKLNNILREIKECSREFVKLDAYLAYRAVGMYELGSDRLKSKDSEDL